MSRFFMILIFLTLFLPAAAQDMPSVIEVPAVGETAESPGDGATGAAIWIHPSDPAQSLILGGDDNEGLGVYDLDGNLLQFVGESGAISNVDLRYNFPFRGQPITLIVGAVKDEPQIAIFVMDAEARQVEPIGFIEAGIRLNGICMAISRLTGTYYVFAVSEEGEVEQHALEDEDGEIRATLAREFEIGSEAEGCVADDALGNLFLAEEETSVIWRYGVEPETVTTRTVVDVLGERIVEQVEGLGLLVTGDRSVGYLVASNEQGDSLLLYERAGDNAFVGEIQIGASAVADRVSEPNGITVVGFPLSDAFPAGLLVTSDDVNSQPNADNNFKLVSWADVAAALDLTIDTAYDPRLVGQTTADVVVDDAVVSLTARAETAPVPSGTDAADDPAIWLHPDDPALSTIIGTDKTNGLVVYDLAGNILQEINIGRVNNVDLRQNFTLSGETRSVVAATNRTFNSLVLYAVDPVTRQLVNVAARDIISGVEEVYGVCLYQSAITGKTYAFVNSADTGEVEQYELIDDGQGRIDAQVVRMFVVGSQTEGCVADDANGTIYIGEEGVGFWRYAAEPDADDARIQVDSTGPDGNLTADVEGITLYATSDGGGYLIVSSQGSSTFALYERGGDNAFIGSFRIVETDTVDAVSGTDGLDVTNAALGDAFPNGLLVVQDDRNLNPDLNQNFKLVDWADVAAAFGLVVDTQTDARTRGQ